MRQSGQGRGHLGKDVKKLKSELLVCLGNGSLNRQMSKCLGGGHTRAAMWQSGEEVPE